ncbi:MULTISPECIES: 50S ribosomal protein L5 [unclassified Fibrobacter]|jgi:large subunit ribosomal protein L5|uniref:50S ribosomal protein L5 n=1 Tax=unclassified Fibrobacter TaxID=2634177 RepID=UPI000BC61655|nr:MULTISPECIES: 50S ribosomal protein L5 [unclassified Fibrobacter]MBQ9226628.1 50S ribosomal protein L5 [Fibrobacter sp.]MBR1744530.1 50S ribosomal protein L5 [Fibrobacter sp.]MBR4008736.1 50S ribosomal protein L5 [Fibrobacter sp.]SOE75790.1 LSU ribosomal protein L5P [Fibrobacter sp. UWT3]
MNQMKQFYLEKVVPALQAKFAYKNVMEIPRLQKIVVNMGVGAAAQNRKILDEAAETLTAITGQKAVVTTAKKAIANFHLREGLGIGAKVTLHGDMMWDFLYRFININLPRVRDFRGLARRGFDGMGNFTLGIKEQTIFVEIDIDKISRTFGMDISFVTSAKTDDEGRALLEELGLPFRK